MGALQPRRGTPALRATRSETVRSGTDETGFDVASGFDLVTGYSGHPVGAEFRQTLSNLGDITTTALRFGMRVQQRWTELMR